ncbi:MAG: hypothetical protein L3J63_09640 [Geopsychrobacter sp.]|nr:hypothetical protein [Geopsychrobacter sp.]
MKKERFESLCQTAESGQDAFISHPDTRERGMVTSCIRPTGHMMIRTPEGQTRCWDYHDCEEMNLRKSGPML